jgi:hypothetical protein
VLYESRSQLGNCINIEILHLHSDSHEGSESVTGLRFMPIEAASGVLGWRGIDASSAAMFLNLSRIADSLTAVDWEEIWLGGIPTNS